MKYFSMFTGIGGFELGIQQAYDYREFLPTKETENIRQDSTDIKGRQARPTCIAYSEIDKYAIQIFEKHFKHKNYGDCTTIIPKELPDFDLLVGGFPCQAFSIAGKRKGFDDTRGTLFFDIARICAEKRPRLVVLENVKGLLSHDQGKTFQTILGVLSDLGYGVEWQVLNSKHFGVPQNRERIFIVGYLGGFPERKVFPIGEDTGETIRTPKRKRITTGRTRNFGSSGQLHAPDETCSTLTTSMGTGGNNVPNVIPINVGHKSPVKETDTASTLMARDYKGIGNQAMSAVLEDARIRRLTPKECERLQGFPDNWTEGISDTQRYKCLGNAVTVNVIREIFKRIYETELL